MRRRYLILSDRAGPARGDRRAGMTQWVARGSRSGGGALTWAETGKQPFPRPLGLRCPSPPPSLHVSTMSRETRIILLLVIDVLFFFTELIVGAQFLPSATTRRS